MAEPEIFKRLLFVDEGDTCVSKMAAAIANHLAAEENLDVVYESAGVFAVPGTPTDPLAIRALKETYGILLADTPSRQLTPELFRAYDRVGSMLYRTNVLINEKAHRWPNLGNFSIVKPTAKQYDEYVACAKNLYQNLVNQRKRLTESGNVLPKRA